jgi:hypothetical protein
MLRRHVAGFEMDLGSPVIIAGNEAVQNLGKEQPFLGAEPAHDAEIHRDQPALIIDEQISGVHVGVEKAVAQRMAQE